MKISMKLVYQYMAIFLNFSPTSSDLHPLQEENCDSNSRLVVDEDDNGKFWLEKNKKKFLQDLLGDQSPTAGWAWCIWVIIVAHSSVIVKLMQILF